MPGSLMYDVVVVGAGSSGAVIAARASEHPDLSVCLIEAGPDYPVLADLPDDLVNSFQNSVVDHDWGYSYAAVAGGATTPFPRGRVIGGSSSVNTAIALRGMPEDYDHWASLGNDGWSWDDVLPAFRRLERDLDFGDEPWHGDAGPITIRRYREDELTIPQAAFLEAAERLGYPACPDANDPGSWGAGPHPMNKAGRVRVSTAIGYLAAARVRPNLMIRCDAPVDRVLLDRSPPRATGVELADGEVVTGRLVVLCAGAIATPLLLQRSGIGPRHVLSSVGIEVVADVDGVGEHLADHPATLVMARVRDPAIIDFDAPLMQAILRYTGDGSAYRNDLQIEPLSFVGRRREPMLSIAPVLEWADSRGFVRVTGTGLDDPPSVEPRLCSERSDAERLAAALADTIRFFETKPISELIDEVTYPRLPVDHATAVDLCRRHVASGYHPCGTARMGPADDPTAVVDSRGRCHAVNALVVADASIMPTVPRANTNLTAIMIGEMVGEWLRRSPSTYGL